jgi:AraC-like DNA-binding protein
VRTSSKKPKRKKARRKATSRRQRRLARALPRRDNSHDDYSVSEWCRRRRISRGLFYKMLKEGTAPATLKLRKRRTITSAADAAWQAQRERETAAEAA